MTTYVLSFSKGNAIGTSITLPKSLTHTSKDAWEFTIPAGATSNANERFVNWYDPDTKTYYEVGDTVFMYPLIPQVTLVAQWEVLSSPTMQITITFEAGDMDEASNPQLPSSQVITTYSQEYEYDYSIIEQKASALRANFIGWYLSQSSGGSPSGSTIIFQYSGSGTDHYYITLVADWEYIYTLNYDPNAPSSGNVSNIPESYTISTTDKQYTFTISTLEPSTTHYTFRGWSGSNSQIYQPGSTLTVGYENRYQVLTALWWYSVYFHWSNESAISSGKMLTIYAADWNTLAGYINSQFGSNLRTNVASGELITAELYNAMAGALGLSTTVNQQTKIAASHFLSLSQKYNEKIDNLRSS